VLQTHLLQKKDFDRLKEMLCERSGITLADHKLSLVQSRLSERLFLLGVKDFAEYCHYLEQDKTLEEWPYVYCALTTNLTRFFRECHHFELLKNYLKQWAELNPSYRTDPATKLRLWSAGCATGQEAYSIACIVADQFGPDCDFDIKILATDLNQKVVEQACQGIYGKDNLKDIPSHYHRYFHKNLENDQIRVKQDIARFVKFGALNLMEPWPMQCRFDVVFCRNVAIYFSAQAQNYIFSHIARIMKDNGLLCIGHAENLFDLKTLFQSIGQTSYVRTKAEVTFQSCQKEKRA
jgi:chemotaxis protein methyltransferase CheR